MKQKVYFFKISVFGIKGILKKVRKYLKSGIYTIKNNFYTIYNINVNNNNNIKTFIDNSNLSGKIKKCLIDKIANKKYKIDNKYTSYSGELVVITSSRQQYKIFDFDNNNVIVKYLSTKKYDIIKKNYHYISKLFNTPKIIKYNDEELVTIEQYIFNENISDKKEQIFNEVLNIYIRTGNKVELMNDKFQKQSKNISKTSFFQKINKYISKNTVLQNIKYIKCHGDLWSSNILLKDNTLYFIDYEKVDYYSVFYDIYFYMFSEAYILNNYLLLNNYLDGQYDKLLKKYFSIFNMKFDSNKKKDYFIFFIQEYANNKWSKLSSRSLNFEINKINILLTKMNIDIEEVNS